MPQQSDQGRKWPWARAMASLSAQPTGPRPLLRVLPAALGVWCLLLGVLQGWDEGAREEQVLLGLGLWVPGGLMPFSGLKIVLLTWSGARAQGSQAGQMGEGCLLEAA